MGTISLEHGDRLYWLGRYTERVFTTLKALQDVYDRMLDNEGSYTEFLGYFEMPDIYGNSTDFFCDLLYNRENTSSVAHSLDRAYDNGIVLREDISSGAFSFLQVAKDTLKKSKTAKNRRLALLPLEDVLYGFWGCIADNIYDEEIKNIIYCGKSTERLDLYLRMKYPYEDVSREFERLCIRLGRVPKNTPYRYNTRCLSDLVEIIGEEDEYDLKAGKAVKSLEHLYETA